MISYHCEFNTILQAPFKTKKDTHHVAVYIYIIKLLKACGHIVDLKILDKKYSAKYKRVIGE